MSGQQAQPVASRFERFGPEDVQTVVALLRPCGRWRGFLTCRGPLFDALLAHGRIVPGQVMLWGFKAPAVAWPDPVITANHHTRKEPSKVEAFVIAGELVAYQTSGAIMVHRNDPIMRGHLQRSLALFGQIARSDEALIGLA